MKAFTIGLIGGCLLAAGTARADDMNSSEDYLHVQRSENIPYVSGGVGIEERHQLKSMVTGDNLELSFALTNGHYLGGAEVSVKDPSGKELVETVADGPLFFAKLPAGRYIVEATAMGKTITRVVNISPNGQAHIFFAWTGSDHDRSTG
jgi:hypothetical protein